MTDSRDVPIGPSILPLGVRRFFSAIALLLRAVGVTALLLYAVFFLRVIIVNHEGILESDKRVLHSIQNVGRESVPTTAPSGPVAPADSSQLSSGAVGTGGSGGLNPYGGIFPDWLWFLLSIIGAIWFAKDYFIPFFFRDVWRVLETIIRDFRTLRRCSWRGILGIMWCLLQWILWIMLVLVFIGTILFMIILTLGFFFLALLNILGLIATLIALF